MTFTTGGWGIHVNMASGIRERYFVVILAIIIYYLCCIANVYLHVIKGKLSVNLFTESEPSQFPSTSNNPLQGGGCTVFQLNIVLRLTNHYRGYSLSRRYDGHVSHSVQEYMLSSRSCKVSSWMIRTNNCTR